jgi:16S rRNA processing protein RimM
MPEPREGFRAVGRVERPWGLRGEIKVLPLTDFPERFTPQAQLYVAREQRRVLRSRWQKGRVFLALDGVERVEAAETLRGELLEVAADDVPDFADGEYYLDDVEGCEVFTDTGESLGRVREVLQPGSNDVYVVHRPGRRDLLVPAVREVVLSVDVESKRITVDLPDGLDGSSPPTDTPPPD